MKNIKTYWYGHDGQWSIAVFKIESENCCCNEISVSLGSFLFRIGHVWRIMIDLDVSEALLLYVAGVVNFFVIELNLGLCFRFFLLIKMLIMCSSVVLLFLYWFFFIKRIIFNFTIRWLKCFEKYTWSQNCFELKIFKIIKIIIKIESLCINDVSFHLDLCKDRVQNLPTNMFHIKTSSLPYKV